MSASSRGSRDELADDLATPPTHPPAPSHPTQTPVAAAPAARAVRANVGAKWYPGTQAPAHLDGTAPGDFGFDPLGLGKDAAVMQRMKEAELVHCRFAMLGIAGMLAVEALGFGNWYDAPTTIAQGGPATFFGNTLPGADASSLAIIVVLQVFMMGGAEMFRATNADATQRMYPGGAFNPAGLGDDASKVKELKNGRLAMLATVGVIGQHAATGEGPIAALSAHLADPWGANFATNGVSFPIIGSIIGA